MTPGQLQREVEELRHGFDAGEDIAPALVALRARVRELPPLAAEASGATSEILAHKVGLVRRHFEIDAITAPPDADESFVTMLNRYRGRVLGRSLNEALAADLREYVAEATAARARRSSLETELVVVDARIELLRTMHALLDALSDDPTHRSRP